MGNRQESGQRSMRVSAILFACVAFLALQASAEELKAETDAQPTESKFFSPGMMYPGVGHGLGAGWYGNVSRRGRWLRWHRWVWLWRIWNGRRDVRWHLAIRTLFIRGIL